MDLCAKAMAVASGLILEGEGFSTKRMLLIYIIYIYISLDGRFDSHTFSGWNQKLIIAGVSCPRHCIPQLPFGSFARFVAQWGVVRPEQLRNAVVQDLSVVLDQLKRARNAVEADLKQVTSFYQVR